MTTRSGRRAANADGPQLSHIEALLIAQGAWEMGTASSTWPATAKILSKHPLVTRPKSFFTAQSCHAMYDNLIQAAGLEVTEASSQPQSETNLTLAQKHYQLRMDELHQLILAEENAFKTILKEIEDIKAGKWDEQIKANLTGQASSSPANAPAEQSTAPVESGGDEILSGSDLSGVTESSSPSATRDSGTPTVTKSENDQLTEAPTGAEPPDVAAEEQLTPTAPPAAEAIDIEAEEALPAEMMPLDALAPEGTIDSVMTDGTVAQMKDDETEQPRREEEEEEEDVNTTKPEEEETDHDEDEEEMVAGRSVSGEEAKLVEHQPEEEEEEEETKDVAPEPADAAEDKAPEGEAKSPQAAPPEQEEHEAEKEPEQPEEEASDEEPAQVTRRSTRNRPALPAAPVTRKTRRQRRVSELEIQSDGENAEGEDTKPETPQDEERASSPVPVEPIGTRRRKRKSSVPEPVESPRDRKRQRDESEPPDDDEPGPSAGGRRRRGDRSEEQLAQKKFQNVISMLHSQITQHRNGNIFHNPIRTVEAPDYHDIVKRPMDLKTIKGRLKDGLITNSLEYQRDIFLMFANAMMYNRPGSDVYHMAEDMMHESEVYINQFKQTEGLVRNRP
ncbi:Bromodomain-containing protein 8 [Leucoagaricus sp. SymC.cos]|nr:Bromodomain-containing protein 8 [Leucoagaricus sp. SymC.cos]